MITKKTTIEFNYQEITFPRQWDGDAENVIIRIKDSEDCEADIVFTEVEQVDEIISQLYLIKTILSDVKKSREAEA